MAAPIIAVLRQRTDLKESLLHTATELAHRCSIYGVVRVSNGYMGQKCHCHKRTFQRHVVKLEQAHILKKTVVKKVVKIRVGDRSVERLRNEINTYTFTIPWQKPGSHKAPMDKIATNLPPQEREKNCGVKEELENQKKGIRFLTPGTDLWWKVSEEIGRLEGLLPGSAPRSPQNASGGVGGL
jgi:hypothetical protein